MKRIPILTDNPAFTYVCALEGQSYRFTFTFNARSADWHMDIAEENGTAIISGIRLVCNWQLIGRSRDSRLPPGMLVCLSLDPNDESPPDLSALGRRVRLIYYDTEDLEAIDSVTVDPVPGSWVDTFGASGPIVTDP